MTSQWRERGRVVLCSQGKLWQSWQMETVYQAQLGSKFLPKRESECCISVSPISAERSCKNNIQMFLWLYPNQEWFSKLPTQDSVITFFRNFSLATQAKHNAVLQNDAKDPEITLDLTGSFCKTLSNGSKLANSHTLLVLFVTIYKWGKHCFFVYKPWFIHLCNYSFTCLLVRSPAHSFTYFNHISEESRTGYFPENQPPCIIDASTKNHANLPKVLQQIIL